MITNINYYYAQKLKNIIFFKFVEKYSTRAPSDHKPHCNTENFKTGIQCLSASVLGLVYRTCSTRTAASADPEPHPTIPCHHRLLFPRWKDARKESARWKYKPIIIK